MLRFILAGLLITVTVSFGCNKSNDKEPAPGADGQPKSDKNVPKPVPVSKLNLTVPDGWKINVAKDSPEMMMGPNVDGFQTNIGLAALPFTGTIDQFEDERLKDLQERYIEFQLLSRSDFTTKENRKGIKSAIEANLFGKRLRLTFYAFDGPDDMKHFFTCTVSAAQGDKFDKKFDEIIASYKP